MSTTTPLPIPEQIQKLRTFLAEDPDAGWNKAWDNKFTPWDVGAVQPPFYDILKSTEIGFPRTGRALVPGCGRAFDAIYIANELGLDTLAIDIAPSAVKAAEALIASQEMSGKVSVRVQDFFNFEVPESEKFDLVYDYTFFVAIRPYRRKEWGSKMSSIVKPGGYLVTLAFPLDSQDFDGPLSTVSTRENGPPFLIRVEDYAEVLGDVWTKVIDKVPERSEESHINKERIVVWRRNL
ncbi:S-adenosyl-L-methionine-dependent methyltransferase [Trametopsis cervina]|nr:S-adenosyl-L-methionine-dependent methyltransferase [Trametopsis cervina]